MSMQKDTANSGNDPSIDKEVIITHRDIARLCISVLKKLDRKKLLCVFVSHEKEILIIEKEYVKSFFKSMLKMKVSRSKDNTLNFRDFFGQFFLHSYVVLYTERATDDIPKDLRRALDKEQIELRHIPHKYKTVVLTVKKIDFSTRKITTKQFTDTEVNSI